jgi:hypothetical protein
LNLHLKEGFFIRFHPFTRAREARRESARALGRAADFVLVMNTSASPGRGCGDGDGLRVRKLHPASNIR